MDNTPIQIVTMQHFEEFKNAVLEEIRKERAQPAYDKLYGYPLPMLFYSIPQIEEMTKISRTTIYEWISKGKRDKNGDRVYLDAFKFGEDYRIHWSKLLEFGKLFDEKFERKFLSVKKK